MRGYEAVRTASYPHLLALDAGAAWEMQLSSTFSGFADDPRGRDVEGFGLRELHLRMAQSAYYDEVGYHYERFDNKGDNKGYENLVRTAKPVYRASRAPSAAPRSPPTW